MDIYFKVGGYRYMSETAKIGKKAQIVIPKSIRKRVNITEGDKVFIDVINNTIVITPVPKDISELSGIARGLYKEDYIAEERDDWD